MKRISVAIFAAVLAVAFCAPVWALENEFGGYWRTRAYTNQDFSGTDDETKDYTVVDTRTRLYYTAKLTEDLKFVNKFEFDATWGDTGHGDIGADGKNVEVKNSYVDFNLATGRSTNLNFKVGVQGATIAKGFLFDDDFAGGVMTVKTEGIDIPVMWIKAYEGNNNGTGLNKRDVDYYGVAPVFTIGSEDDNKMTVNPFLVYVASDNAQDWEPLGSFEDVGLYFLGLDFNMTMSMMDLFFVGIYQGGSVDLKDNGGSADFAAYLAAVGGSLKLMDDMLDIHGQAFYASGQDEGDSDVTRFYVPKGQSYYWAEIMGYGIFDNDVSNNSCADQISNIMALNAGAAFTPRDSNITLKFDVWYASLAEEDPVIKEKDLGIELDAGLSWKIAKGLNMDVVAAYLLAGDVTTGKADNDANPWELGTQFSIKF